MNRRSVLMGLMALTFIPRACQPDEETTLRIAALKEMLPPQVLANFKEHLAKAARLRLDTPKTSAQLFTQLQRWHTAAIGEGERPILPRAIADWVCLSDYWLFAAIQQALVSPIPDLPELPGWSEVPSAWRSLLQRDQQGFWDKDGSLWAAPYRWGHLMMTYSNSHFERLDWQPATWEDLWNPALQGRIALPNHPRLVIGIVLKALGYSANDTNPDRPEVLDALAALRPQVKFYTSDDYLEALIVGDIWLAVGWSTEIQPVLKSYRQLAAVSPAPGTLLTADVWVRPNLQAEASAMPMTALDQQWLSYWWQPEVRTPLTLFSQGLSPLLLDPAVLRQPLDFSQESIFIPEADHLEDSEFVQPLPEAAIAAYTKLWRILRGGE